MMKRRREDCEEETLRLLLEPKGAPGKVRKLSKYHRIDVKEGNRVQGFVQGHPCPVQLDSGANRTVIFFSQAERFGLLTGKEEKVTEEFILWLGTRNLDIIKLPEVVITLEGGLEVKTPVVVLPQELEQYYEADDVVLDLHQLCRSGVVQTFSPSGSSIYIRHPERLRRKSRGTRPRDLQIFGVRRKGSECPMKVLLDTGADTFCVSEYGLELLMKETGRSEAPRRVSLDLGNGSCLEAEEVEVNAVNCVDFVMGDQLMRKYNAVVDYSRHSVTFTVGGKRLKIGLRQE